MAAEGDLRTGGQVVDDLDHHRALLAAIEIAGAERTGISQFRRFARALGLLQPPDAVRDHGDPHTGPVHVESPARQRCVERLVALRYGAASGEAGVERAPEGNHPFNASQCIDPIRRQPTLPSSELGDRELDLQPRLAQQSLGLRPRLLHTHIEVYAGLRRSPCLRRQRQERRHQDGEA